MKLESIALWEEKELFFDRATGNPAYGALGFFRGNFTENSTLNVHFEPTGENNCREVEQRCSFLCNFLMTEYGSFLFRSQKDMERYCAGHLHDHVFYPFNRECWGFRVLDDDYAWYIACTPWNSGRQVSVYCYDRTALMTEFARPRGLPEACHAVLKFTGERIYIRFGADTFEVFPQYGGRMNENLAYAVEQNESLGISVRQMAAMEGGAVYGWETPMADIQNYDGEGHYVPPALVDGKEKKRR